MNFKTIKREEKEKASKRREAEGLLISAVGFKNRAWRAG